MGFLNALQSRTFNLFLHSNPLPISRCHSALLYTGERSTVDRNCPWFHLGCNLLALRLRRQTSYVYDCDCYLSRTNLQVSLCIASRPHGSSRLETCPCMHVLRWGNRWSIIKQIEVHSLSLCRSRNNAKWMASKLRVDHIRSYLN